MLSVFTYRHNSLYFQFYCLTDATCIPLELVCNNKSDCSDESDEAECAGGERKPSKKKERYCGDHLFECGDGSCIPIQFLCDSNMDCIDGTDESDCG